MKRIFTIVVLIASLVFTSCEDFLTEDVRGQLNVDTYYKSIEECESAVTSCYQAMTYGGWWQINTVWLLSEMCGDDAWMGNTLSLRVIISHWHIIRETVPAMVLSPIFGSTVTKVFYVVT